MGQFSMKIIPSTGSRLDGNQQTDGKMYRWDGTAWVTGVNVEDIDGQIPGDRIEDLPAEKLTGQVTADQIAHDAVGPDQLAKGVFGAEHLADKAIPADKIADDLRALIDAQGQSAAADKAAAEAAAGIAVTAKGQAEIAASAAVTSRDQAAVSATGAAQSAAAASVDKIAAETARGQAQIAATQAAQSKTDAAGSASAAATSATVSASAKDAALEIANTPRVMVPPYPSALLRNFWHNTAASSEVPASSYGSDGDGAFVQRATSNWYGALYLHPLVPMSADRVYRLTIKLKHSHAMTTFGRIYLGYADANRANLSALNFTLNETVVPDTMKTLTMVLGRAAGGLVTRVIADNQWVPEASFVRFGLSHNSFATDIHTFKIHEFLIEDVTEADTAARQAQAAGLSANAAAGSASSAEASNSAAGQSALAATTAKTEAETARGQARTSATEAAQSKTDAAGSAANAANSATLSATAKGAAETARDGAAASATAASTSAGAAQASANLAGEKATAATQQANTATTKAGEASTSANQAAQAKSDAEGSANAAATSANVSANVLSQSQRLLNTARPLLPAIPSKDAANFTYTSTGFPFPPPAPDSSYGSDADGDFITRDTLYNWYRVGPVGRVPLSPDRVYRFSYKIKSDIPVTPRLYLQRVSADESQSAVAGFITLTEVVTTPDVAYTGTVVVGAVAGGLVTRVQSPASWGGDPTMPFLRPAMAPANSVMTQFKLYQLLIEDVTEADAAARSAGAAGLSANAAAGSATSAAASETAAGQSALAANTAKTQAETARGQAQTSATEAAQSKTDAAGSAANAANSATLSASAKGAAETARDGAAASATAASQSAGAAEAWATLSGEKATAATTQANTATTKAGEASTSANQAAQSKLDAAGSANAAQASATVSATALSQSQQLLNTAKLMLPSIPSSTAANFSISAYPSPAADSVYGSDEAGPFAMRNSNSVWNGLGQVGLLPIDTGKVYRLTIRFSVDVAHRPNLVTRCFDAGSTTVKRSNAYPFTDVEVPTNTVTTVSHVCGTVAGGLVTKVINPTHWGSDAPLLGLQLSPASGVTAAIKIYEWRTEDVTEADAAARSAAASGTSAGAAATSASQAAASETAAGQSAVAANTAKTQAETARGQAQTSASEAAQSKTDAAGSASIAQAQAELAATSKGQADASALAASQSAATASTKASEAGVSATAANTSKLSAETQAGIATVKASESVTSATAAAGSATEAASFAQLAALATGAGMVKNPTFRDWTGAAAPNVSHLASAQGSIAKAAGKYGNAVKIAVTGTANYGPGIQLLNLTGSKNPAKVLLTIEVEILSGNPNGMVLQTGWRVGTTTTWVHTRIGHRLTAGSIQTFQIAVDRPTALASAAVEEFTYQLRTSYNAGGGTYSLSEVLVHRVEALEVVAESYIDQQLKTKATVDGLAETSYVLRIKAGGASAGLEMVAASDPKGSASAIRAAADEILLDGSVKAKSLAVGSVGAEQVAARAMTARHFAVADFTNLVPDDQLQDRLSWAITNPNAAEFRDTGELAIKPQSLGYIRFSGALSGGTFSRAHSAEFPVEGNEEFFCSGEAWRQSGSAPNSGITFHIQFRDGDGNWMVPDQRFYYRYLTAEGLQSGAQIQSGSVVAPANARSARIYISMLAGTDGNWIAASPLVRRKFGGKMMVEGELEARHIKFGTLTGGLMASTGIITKAAQIDDAVIRRAHIGLAEIDELRIKDNAFFVPYRFTAAATQIPTANHINNRRLLLNQTITGLGAGGFTVGVDMFMDATAAYDCFGGVNLTTTIDGVIVASASTTQRFGIRTSGANTVFRMPISFSRSAFGGASVNFKLYGYNGRWDGDFDSINPETGTPVGPRTSNPFTLESIALSVSASRR